jgi:hypothetical protein
VAEQIRRLFSAAVAWMGLRCDSHPVKRPGSAEEAGAALLEALIGDGGKSLREDGV